MRSRLKEFILEPNYQESLLPSFFEIITLLCAICCIIHIGNSHYVTIVGIVSLIVGVLVTYVLVLRYNHHSLINTIHKRAEYCKQNIALFFIHCLLVTVLTFMSVYPVYISDKPIAESLAIFDLDTDLLDFVCTVSKVIPKPFTESFCLAGDSLTTISSFTSELSDFDFNNLTSEEELALKEMGAGIKNKVLYLESMINKMQIRVTIFAILLIVDSLVVRLLRAASTFKQRKKVVV